VSQNGVKGVFLLDIPNSNEKTEVDKKIQETWYLLTEIEKALINNSDDAEHDKELALIRKYKFALTSLSADHLLLIEDEAQTLQCVNFKGTKELEKYTFTEGKSIFYIHLEKKQRLFHLGMHEYECKSWYETIPARMQVLDLAEDGDTISVEYFFDKNKLKHKKNEGNEEDSLDVNIIPRVIGKIDLDSISEWLMYLYRREVINDNIGLDLIEHCDSGVITGLDGYLEKLCEEFSSYLKRFKAKPGDWLKLYLLLQANITNNLIVVTDDTDSRSEEEEVPDISESSPVLISV